MSIDLAKWVLSSIIQAEAAVLGLTVAAIGIVVIFLYRDGQYLNKPDRIFVQNFPSFSKHIKKSFSIGFIGVMFSLFSLLTIETNIGYYRNLLCWLNSFVFITSLFYSIMAGVELLKIIKKHIN